MKTAEGRSERRDWARSLSLSAAVIAIVAAATLTLSHAQLATAPWPMFHGDLGHTGLSPVDTSANTGNLKWKFNTGGVLWGSSPTVGAGGTIYVGSNDGNLYALTDGGQGIVTEKWRFITSPFLVSSPAVGADGTIYVGSDDYNVYALNPDGSLKWKFATGDWVWSSPAVGADGTIYIGSNDNNVYALGAETLASPTATTLTAAPAELNFGNVDATGTSKPRKVALTNKGTAAAVIGSVTATPAFGIAGGENTCSGQSLAPKKSARSTSNSHRRRSPT